MAHILLSENYKYSNLYQYLIKKFLYLTVKLLCCQTSCLSLTTEIFCTVMLPQGITSAGKPWVSHYYTLSQMTGLVLITVLCITWLDEHPCSQEAILCCSSVKLYCALFLFESGYYRTQPTNYLTLYIPHVRTNVGRTGFRYCAPFK